MRKPAYNDLWPTSWKESYAFNEMELWGSRRNLGYTYAYLNRREKIFQAIRRLVQPRAKILDVAASHGNFTLPLAEQGYHLVWNDIRGEMEGYVRLKHEKGHVDYMPGNCFDLTEQHANSFDAIIATEIIEHVAHPDRFLKGLENLLKPGGYIFLSTPNGKWIKNRLPRFSEFENPEIFESQQFKPDADGHIFLLHPDEFHLLARKTGLELALFELVNTPLLNGNRHLARLLRFIPQMFVTGSESILTRFLPRPLLEKWTYNAIAVFRKPSGSTPAPSAA